MRLFIAVDFPGEVKDVLSRCVGRLREASARGNFTRRENLHLTLAFVGETADAAPVRRAMEAVAQPPFELEIDGFGRFRRPGGDIYWLGFVPNPALASVRACLCTSLRAQGFVPEDRPFSPHLTLGRQVVPRPDFDREAFGAAVPPVRMTVKKLSLMRSDRPGGVLTYTEVDSRVLTAPY